VKKDILRFDTQQRKYSSNAIQGTYVDEYGQIHTDVIITINNLSKNDGDILSKEIVDKLNHIITLNQEYPF
jgi:hypothetical protein